MAFLGRVDHRGKKSLLFYEKSPLGEGEDSLQKEFLRAASLLHNDFLRVKVLRQVL